jgi:hypothetical protein
MAVTLRHFSRVWREIHASVRRESKVANIGPEISDSVGPVPSPGDFSNSLLAENALDTPNEKD